jgi:multiple sugar transport system substrate-binding protein
MKDDQQDPPKPPGADEKNGADQSGEITPPWVNVEEDAQIEGIGSKKKAPEEPLPTEIPGSGKPKEPEKKKQFRPVKSEPEPEKEAEPQNVEMSESEQKTVAAQGTQQEKPQPKVEPEKHQVESKQEKKQEPQPQPQPTPQEDFIKKSPFRKLMPILGIVLVGAVIFFVAFKVVPGLIKKGKNVSSSLTGGGDDGGGSSRSAGKQVELVYWGLWEPESVITSLIAEYKKENPNVNIQYTQQSHKDYRERLQSSLAKGEGPDIFRFHSTWVPMMQKELSAAPNKVASEINLKNSYFSVVSDDLVVGGQTAGVPIGFDSLVLYYNTEMLREANETPPSTWEELRTLAKKLTVTDSSGKIKKAGVALGTTNNVDNWSDILGLMLLQNGADPAQPEESLAGDAIEFYSIFSLSDKVWDETLPNSTYAFATEKVAMIIAPSWRAFQINKINPDIQYKAVPAPQLPGDKVGWATYWAEGVWSKSKNEEEAWKFLQFLSTKKALNTFYNSASEIRAFGEPYPRVDMAAQIEDDPIAGAVVEQGSYAKSWYLSSRTWDNGINDKIIKYYENGVNSYLEGDPLKKVVPTINSGVKQVLSQYGLSQSSNQ